jgi:hypothetical protein
VTPCPKALSSATVNAYGTSQYGVQSSGVWTSHWYLPSASPEGREKLSAHNNSTRQSLSN